MDFRLNLYWNLVDFFVISESKFAFNGNEKPLHASNYLKKYNIDTKKVIIVEYKPSSEMISNSRIDRWPIENFARQSLLNGIHSTNSSDIVILSDADEFASIEQIKNAKKTREILSAQTPMYFRKGNYLVLHSKKWNRVRIGPLEKMTNLNLIRNADFPKVKGEVGMHLSYLELSDTDILRKHKTSAHSEIDKNNEFLLEAFKVGKKYGIDHLGRFESQKFGLIKVINKNKLNNFHTSFLLKYPEYFDFNPIRINYFRRVSASRRLTIGWKSIDVQEIRSIDNLNNWEVMVDLIFAIKLWLRKCILFIYRKLNSNVNKFLAMIMKKLPDKR